MYFECKADVIALGWMPDDMPIWLTEWPFWYIMCYFKFVIFMDGR